MAPDTTGTAGRSSHRRPPGLFRSPLPRAHDDLARGFRIVWLSWSVLPPAAYILVLAAAVFRDSRWPVRAALAAGAVAAVPWWRRVRAARREYLHYRSEARMMRRVSDRVRQRQDADAATRMVEDFATYGAPFILLLRGFAGEASGRPARNDYNPQPQTRRELRALRLANPGFRVEPGFLSLGAVGDVERGLAAAVDGRLPVLAVTNPDDEVGASVVARLALPAEEWEEGVAALIRGASLVVLDCAALSPGVVRELELLQELDAQDRAVVVVSRPPDQADRDLLLEVLGGEAIDVHPIADPAAAPLSAFPRVVRLAEVDFDDLWADCHFADLLTAAERRAGIALANRAMASHDGGGPGTAAALPMLERASAALLRAGDPAGSARARINLGVAQADLGDPTSGLATLDAVAAELTRVGDVAGLGTVRAHIARILYATDRVDEAFAEAECSLDAFGESSDPIICLALRVSGQAAIELDDLETAWARFSRLLAVATEYDRSDEVVRAHLHLGMLAAADDWPAAQQQFRAAVALAETLDDPAQLQQLQAIVHDFTARHARALAAEGVAALDMRDAAKAVESLSQAHGELDRLGEADAKVTFRLAMALHASGRVPEAIDRFAESAGLARDAGDRRAQGLALSNLGALEQKEGRTREALGHLTEAMEIQRTEGSDQEIEWTLLSLVPALLAADRTRDARKAAEELRVLMGDRWPEEETATHPFPGGTAAPHA